MKYLVFKINTDIQTGTVMHQFKDVHDFLDDAEDSFKGKTGKYYIQEVPGIIGNMYKSSINESK